MKILQNETSNAATPNDSDITEKEKLQQHQQLQQHQSPPIVEKRKAKTLKNKILQNVAQQQQQLASSVTTTTASTIAMPDELSVTETTTKTTATIATRSTPTNTSNNNNNITSHNSRNTSNDYDTNIAKDSTSDAANCNNNKNRNKNHHISSSINNSNSDLIIAEAAKILLKNGLNGTNAAAAAAVATATATLLTAAANFQLPQQQHSQNPHLTSTTLSSSSKSASPSESSALAANATTAAAAHAQLVAIAAAAAAVNATNHKRLTDTLTALNNTASSFSSNSNLNSSKSSHNQQLNNNGLLGSSVSSSPTSTTSISQAAATSTSATTNTSFVKPFKSTNNNSSSGNVNATMPSSSSMDMGVIDYTINSSQFSTSTSSLTSVANSNTISVTSSSSTINLSGSANNNSHHKYINSSSSNNSINNNAHLNRSDIGRPPISHPSTKNHNNATSGGGFGGRLQFFKDGKFILELARSKDGEKGGWVSVPRKIFRTPSAATSSTVTPAATATTSAAIIPQPLAASPPASVIGGVVGGNIGVGISYPKNECSNSLSFSDDNSSLQSSPWQRDHCWKQAAPRKNVSKEMTLFYHKPACRKLTAQALLLAQRKRRRPYDMKILEKGLVFGLNKTTEQGQVDDKFQLDIEVETKEEIDDKKEKAIGVKSTAEDDDNVKTEIDDTNGAKKESADDNTNILKQTDVECNDVEMSKLSPVKKEDDKENEAIVDPKQDEVEKMNTSDCDVVVETSKKSSSLNGDVANEDSKKLVPGTATKEIDCKKQGDEEKRLNKPENIKTRAKLTTIVQKLIDASASRSAATAQSFKNSTQQHSPLATATFTSSIASSSSLGVGGAKNQISKVSPPSNTAASRLVEYHQQHVSPRKRILREFEKVSLEDNASAAGGKRSRAKGNSTPNSVPAHPQALSSPMNKTSSSGGYSGHNSSAGNQTKVGVVTSAAPTKLYSSYSIHSLLGGGSSSNSSVSQSSSSSKKSSDLPATITSNSLAFSSSYHHSSSISHNAHQSPKSPEVNATCGGKSPSNSASKLKRSPPYNSPMRDTHSRSPTTNAGSVYDYGRRSPRLLPEVYNKLKYSGTTESNTGSPHHQHQHHLQQQQQQHYHHTPQSYYSTYLTSPHYVPPAPLPLAAAGSALSPSTSSTLSGTTTPSSNTAVSSSRSPRHLSSAFRATTPTSSTIVGNNANHNIPSTQRGDLSPQRSTTASPRETTPRTVPKKTASIRRQFASPTSVNTTTSTNSSSCTSPTAALDNRNEDNERRTPVSHQQHLLHRASPGSANMQSSSLNPYSYMYAPGANSPHPASAVSPTSSNSSAAAAAAAVAAASYIPAVVGSPYYHPYISTLAAMRHPQMWIQHYQNAAAAAANPAALLQASRHPAMLSAAAAGAARLSPPYHGYQYNGVGNAAALAAAAAAAGFGSASAATPPHHHTGSTLPPPGSMFNPMMHGMASHPATMHAAAGLVPAASAAAAVAALGSAQPMTDTTTDLSKPSKNNFSSSSSSSLASSSPLPGTGVSGSSSTALNSMYPTSNKDEQSSDVPLNLSKH